MVLEEISPVDAKTVQVQRVNKKLTFVEPKSGTSRRTISLPECAVAALKRQQVQQKAARLAAGADWCQTRLGLLTRRGGVSWAGPLALAKRSGGPT